METKVKTKPEKKSKAVQIIATEEHLPMVSNTPDMLLARAIEKGVDIAQLEKLMDLQERWQNKIAKQEYLESFAKFQQTLPELVKNKEVKYESKTGGGKTEYGFHQLPDIAKHIREPLGAVGLAYKWGQKDEGNKISVWCIITHTSGHEEVGEPLTADADTSGNKTGIHAKGSTISYLRRYTLTGMLGLSSGDMDDDGRKGNVKAPEGSGLDDNGFATAFKKVMSGDWTVEFIEGQATLNEKQRSALQKAQDDRAKK